MNLLIVGLHSSRVGKANLDVFNPAAELARRGHTVHVISRDDLDSPRRNPVNVEGVWVHPIAFTSALHCLFFLPVFVLRVFRIAADTRPDVIIADNDLHCPFVGYLVARVQKRPLLVLLRELTADALYHDTSRTTLKRGLAWLMMKAGHSLLSRVQHKLAINPGIARYYAEVLGERIPSIWLLGFDLSRFDCSEAIIRQTACKYSLQRDKIIALYTGTLTLERGIQSVFLALSQLPDPDRLQLVVTGEGKALDALKEEVSRLGISDHVSFLGWLTAEELDALLCLADIGLEPYSRPWPQDHTPSTKVALYVAAGLFVVATNAPGYHEIISQGENGHLYRKPDDLADLLQEYAAHPELLNSPTEQSRGGRDRVSIVPIVDSLETVLRKLVVQAR